MPFLVCLRATTDAPLDISQKNGYKQVSFKIEGYAIRTYIDHAQIPLKLSYFRYFGRLPAMCLRYRNELHFY